MNWWVAIMEFFRISNVLKNVTVHLHIKSLPAILTCYSYKKYLIGIDVWTIFWREFPIARYAILIVPCWRFLYPRCNVLITRLHYADSRYTYISLSASYATRLGISLYSCANVSWI